MGHSQPFSYKFRDLVVTMFPAEGGCDSTSGGCQGTTTGALCTSEGCLREAAACAQSDEILDPLRPLIDPAYMVELRLLLRLAVAKSRGSDTSAIEASMRPNSVQEISSLEAELSRVIAELADDRRRRELESH
jgi:hypothetical protein